MNSLLAKVALARLVVVLKVVLLCNRNQQFVYRAILDAFAFGGKSAVSNVTLFRIMGNYMRLILLFI